MIHQLQVRVRTIYIPQMHNYPCMQLATHSNNLGMNSFKDSASTDTEVFLLSLKNAWLPPIFLKVTNARALA